MQWFYVQNEQRIGPIAEDELFRLVREGLISPDTLVWNPSLGDQWQPASAIPGLFADASAPSTARPGLTRNSLLMEKARFSLRGQWGTAIGVTLLLFLINNVFSFASEFTQQGAKALLSGIDFLIAIFVAGPLLVGWSRYFMEVARNQRPPFRRLFSGFQSYWKAVIASFLMGLYVLLAAIPAALVGVGAAIAIPAVQKSGILTSATSVAGMLLAVSFFLLLLALASIPCILVSLNYSQTFFVLADQPGLRASQALAHSRSLMVGCRWKRVCLDFRFIGWIFLGILTLGIGFLWIAPYMAAAYAHFYNDIRRGS